MFSLADNLNSIPDKSDVSIKEVSTFSLKAISLSIIKVPVGCSFLTTTSTIGSPSWSLSKSLIPSILNLTLFSNCKNPFGVLISSIS